MNQPQTKIQKPKFAKKSLGQNFLIDQNYIRKIISALDPQANETIIEIGPGRGALTKYLLESGANVIAVELDRDLIPLLQNEFGGYANFQVIEGNALEIDFRRFISSQNSQLKIKLAANLPYYISTAILQHLISQREIFSEFVLMLQKEVVERITAQAGSSERGFLTVLVETACEAQKICDVPPTAFRPVPKVWSSVVRLKTKVAETCALKEDAFKEIVSAGFIQKRKTIQNNLKSLPHFKYKIAEILHRNGIDPSRRAESLTLTEWTKLADEYK